jgi:hypothetical protein
MTADDTRISEEKDIDDIKWTYLARGPPILPKGRTELSLVTTVLLNGYGAWTSP